jgi:hypothetical protein
MITGFYISSSRGIRTVPVSTASNSGGIGTIKISILSDSGIIS